MLPSRRRERSRRWLGVMLSLTSWLAAGATGSAQDQASGQRFRRENHTQSSSQPTPLERLRNRSAQERWQRHRDNERWSPADPFQRDWPVEETNQTPQPSATENSVSTAPATSAPPAPFPWAGNDPSSDAATDAVNSGPWQSNPEVADANLVAPPVATETEQPVPTLAIPRDPFADSRWVELSDDPEIGTAPALEPTPAATRNSRPAAPPSTAVFGIAPLPETPYSNPNSDSAVDESSDPMSGLIAPRGVSTLAVADDGTEAAPLPLDDNTNAMNADFLARIKPIREIVPYFQPEPAPVTHSLPTSPTDRGFMATEFTWAASNVYHNPLYFEDFALERYGHTHHPVVQPLASVGKFGAQFVALPYKMAIDPVWDEEYVLGWYRPGELAPYLFYQIPWNWRAATTAAGTYTGLIFLFP